MRAEASVGDVAGIAYDSRAVARGHMFVALKGLQTDGTAFAAQAIERGALAIVSEQPAPPDVRIPWVTVGDARLALAVLAAAFYGHPSREMQVVGITGTNGKTTIAYLLASMFEAAGIRCGVLGTVAYRLGPGEQDVREAARTTPEAPEVQALLREMVDRGCGACAMEVSSHALSLRRADDMTFAAAVFTNLTRDHLDFHSDMEAYFQAKRRLFEMLPSAAPSLLNVDDPRGASLVEAGGRPVTYAINRPADVTTGPLSFSLDGLTFDVRTPRGTLHLRSKLVGRPNVYNILAAVATATALDLPFDAIERGVAALEGVPGRFQVASSAKDEVTVVVDYAHTDDALRNLLETARPLAQGRLITVFGCGGDRDRTKRPLMGAVASRLSDLVVITSDNPRSEDPQRIIDEIQRGITADTRKDTGQLLTIVDRRAAIAKAVEVAKPGDLVLIAGKGHEKYQVIGDQTLPFDDVAVAREALARRRTNSGVV
ncbi:MAG: UDP-N-acetylmuramoyl-L-alanyl-D-glutamate--2,6-diaminopimelate ligase [Acidobacteria bacterium 13_1_40CM_2_64_6]|nr:MAG: UDP-N-acetylmuramoyl-L-alanyl-D-glutamate--2,6-diaminopimelate ligase [Acidobacteria bacterium 13_1_40CM_4_65_8]OLD18630.1 MAG: UDP-N-acetylmuramoyl-L-alanyl-D-glutamate--2,6-diaminopimelate ligase [Acidobacteria bacterium 13_1_40CM_3_65_5]OLD55803.1 MAG: UDP-N-acetylmuramoyl-L-alanyl-D-glutamate--2,6-diaminopimelate ligase [Acidobacteria bacterium 13_1_40CM_2_64_6]OLE79468.1 MAG: UDP-N-acetylmuramoyl-L-alanyl-D-glutamate--2,6-diaminopimelate ligase [Acidobacteria bacterium 13_1_20CM_2_6